MEEMKQVTCRRNLWENICNILTNILKLPVMLTVLIQIFTKRSSGPLLDLDWKTFPAWSEVWGLQERINFVFHFYKVETF